MVPIHFTAGTGAPTATQMGNWTEFWGATGTSAEAYFLKIWWQGNTNTVPVVGTTAPNITIAFPSSPVAILATVFAVPVILQGPMYYAVTKNAGDTDATALSTGGDVITLFVG